MKKLIKAWLVRDVHGKMRRAIFFCGKDYVPADDRHKIVRCLVSFKIEKPSSKRGKVRKERG